MPDTSVCGSFFFGKKMKKARQLDYEKQLKRLSEYGIKCDPSKHDMDVETLETIGYYDLKEFALPFNVAKHKGKAHFESLTFEQLLTRYYQDKNLRINILHAIECIEVYLENRFAYILGKQYGPFGYLNFNSWCDRQKYKRFYIEARQYYFKKGLLKEVQRSTNHDLKHKQNLQDGFPTVWLMVSTLSLGQLKEYIKLSSPKIETKIAQKFDINNQTLESWIECLVLVRNICCHNSNLIDIKLKTPPIVPKNYKDDLYLDNNLYSNHIGIVIFIIATMMDKINPKYDFSAIKRSLKSIIQKDDNLANQLGFTNRKSIDRLKTTRSHNKIKK